VQAFVEDTVRDILYALRTFWRAPLVALTIVSTVALGLGLVAVGFTMFNAMAFRVDAVPDVHEMVGLKRPETAGGVPQPFTRAEFDALRRETNVFTDAFAQVADIDNRVEGQLMFGTFVTGNFFQVLRVSAAMGRVLTPADDEAPAGQPVMVLSHRGWDRLFARDPAILGRRLLVNGVSFEIVGVMPEKFRGLTLAPDDYWAPLSTLGGVSPIHRGREAGLGIIGRLKPGMSLQTAQAGLAIWDSGRSSGRAIERGAPSITLEPRRGTVPQPLEAMLVIVPLFFAFGLILLIGCANVANLLLARALARQREIGIRLSLGATRRRIVRQLLTENVLLALAAAAVGFAISRLVLHTIIDAVMTSAVTDFGDIRLWVPDADWRVTLFLIIGAGVSTMIFGLAPALHAARIDPIGMIRGEVVPFSNDARPGRARNFLVGLQVSASALLLICAAVFLRSAYAAATADPGIRTSDIAAVNIANEENRAAIVQALTAEPSVAAMAAAGALRAAFAEAGGAKAAVDYALVSHDLFNVLDIGIVRGRMFTPAERTPDASVAMVSETAVQTLWPNSDPIGQVIRVDAPEPRTFTVVGIVRDVAGFRFAPFNKAVVYAPTNAASAGTMLVARVRGDPQIARQTLLDRLTMIDPDMARSVNLARTIAGAETYFLEMAFWLTVVLGGLALVLTLSGLFSVLSYLVEQRAREIGVRMALGATTGDITRLVLLQSIRPVGFGLAVGGGAAAGLAALLLSTPAAATIGNIVHVLDPIAYTGSLLIIIAACLLAASIPATRAAHLDPARTLRQQ
jgi:predicted permease